MSDRLTNREPAADAKPRRKRRTNPKKVAERNGQVDIKAILSEPIEVVRGGQRHKMPAVEAGIRQQVKQALKEGSVPALLAVVKIAIDNDVVVPPEKTPTAGGVFIVPKWLPDEFWKRLDDSEDSSMAFMIELIREYHELLHQLLNEQEETTPSVAGGTEDALRGQPATTE